jgi:hypothetical protein
MNMSKVRARLPQIVSVAALLLVLLIAAWGRAVNRTLNQRLTVSDADRVARGEVIDQLANQVKLLCGDRPNCAPVVERARDVPAPAVGERGQQGERGPGPTEEQVRAAVTAYLTANPPLPGRPPTDAEIDAAVSAFCATRNDCAGPAGAAGPRGEQGDSVVGPEGPRGPAGADATDAQVATAVEAFCAIRNGCIGPQGPIGSPGPAPVSWTFTFRNRAFVCSDPDGNLAYDCTEVP